MIPDSPFFLIYISIRRGVTPGPVAQGHANRTGGGGFRMDGNLDACNLTCLIASSEATYAFMTGLIALS